LRRSWSGHNMGMSQVTTATIVRLLA